MTVKNLLDMADELASNALPQTAKLLAFNQIEARIRVDALGQAPEAVSPVQAAELESTELTLPERYHDVYLFWMTAMIYFLVGETEDYENQRRMFEAAWTRFERDVCIERDRRSSCGTAADTQGSDGISPAPKSDLLALMTELTEIRDGEQEAW